MESPSNKKLEEMGLLLDEWTIRFEDLQLGPPIAEGNFGSVYKGKYFHTDVAIKRVHRLVDDDLTSKYIEREITMLRGIRHPNVVAFMGVCQNSQTDDLYIVTEWVPNGSVKNLLEDQTASISWYTRVSIARQVGVAMAFLHRKNLIHRDIKSENLLLTEHGEVKLADFGFARRMSYGNNKQMTLAGTAGWMAPEIILGQEYDQKCDVWSFGVTLYELITRQKPLDRGPAHAFDFDKDKLVALIPPDCPKEFSQLASECCAYNNYDRPSFENILPKLVALEKSLPKDDRDEMGRLLKLTQEKMEQISKESERKAMEKLKGRLREASNYIKNDIQQQKQHLSNPSPNNDKKVQHTSMDQHTMVAMATTNISNNNATRPAVAPTGTPPLPPQWIASHPLLPPLSICQQHRLQTHTSSSPSQPQHAPPPPPLSSTPSSTSDTQLAYNGSPTSLTRQTNSAQDIRQSGGSNCTSIAPGPPYSLPPLTLPPPPPVPASSVFPIKSPPLSPPPLPPPPVLSAESESSVLALPSTTTIATPLPLRNLPDPIGAGAAEGGDAAALKEKFDIAQREKQELERQLTVATAMPATLPPSQSPLNQTSPQVRMVSDVQGAYTSSTTNTSTTATTTNSGPTRRDLRTRFHTQSHVRSRPAWVSAHDLFNPGKSVSNNSSVARPQAAEKEDSSSSPSTIPRAAVVEPVTPFPSIASSERSVLRHQPYQQQQQQEGQNDAGPVFRKKTPEELKAKLLELAQEVNELEEKDNAEKAQRRRSWSGRRKDEPAKVAAKSSPIVLKEPLSAKSTTSTLTTPEQDRKEKKAKRFTLSLPSRSRRKSTSKPLKESELMLEGEVLHREDQDDGQVFTFRECKGQLQTVEMTKRFWGSRDLKMKVSASTKPTVPTEDVPIKVDILNESSKTVIALQAHFYTVIKDKTKKKRGQVIGHPVYYHPVEFPIHKHNNHYEGYIVFSLPPNLTPSTPELSYELAIECVLEEKNKNLQIPINIEIISG